MRFGVLGPLLVDVGDGAELAVAGARQRVLLAALLVHANRVAPAEQLAELVWDGAPPPGAGALRTRVMRLRRTLGEVAHARIITRDPGYLITVGEQEYDAALFEALCLEAGAAQRAGRSGEALDVVNRALALWRGEALVDVPSQALRDGFVPRLQQLHVQALEDRAEAQLHLGQHERLIPQLRELTTVHPLRERFHTQLMLALYRCGRQAEALEAYRDARETLVGELGVEPGPELRSLHERILTGDASLASVHTTAAPMSAARVPRQLPAAAGHFTGRRGELEMLAGLADRSDTVAGSAVVISAIDGMAGIGKTALAVRAAHRLSERFPGGQLFIDLHGYTKGYPPRSAGEALEAFLRALGVSAQQIPEDTEARAALYRQCLAGTRTLIVLDNALDEGQVRPLLPGHGGCLVLITSRRRLKALDDADTLPLDVLPVADAIALFRRVAGPGRAPANDPALAQIVDLCGRLPLALRIAGALLRHRGSWTPGHLATLLREQHHRVIRFNDGDRDVGNAFALSYDQLTVPQRRLFCLLGLAPGPDIGTRAVAALTDTGADTAHRLLQDLVDHHLLDEPSPNRYQPHDLLRLFAAGRAEHEQPNEARRAAQRRLVDHYLHTAARADPRAVQDSAPLALGAPTTGCRPVPLADREEIHAWFGAEHRNLIAAQQLADERGWNETAWLLASLNVVFQHYRGYLTDQIAMARAALKAAQRIGDDRVTARTHKMIGRIYTKSGSHAEAIDALHHALTLARRVEDHELEADSHVALGWAWETAGDDQQALRQVTLAHQAYQLADDFEGEVLTLTQMGWYAARLGLLDQARTLYHRARTRLGSHTDAGGEAAIHDGLGFVDNALGRHGEAIEHYRQAIELYRGFNHEYAEAAVQERLGHPHQALGQHESAQRAWRRALDLYRTQHRISDAERVYQLVVQ